MRLLEELQAFDLAERPSGRGSARTLTAYGKSLARLPLDPRLGRMLLEADRLGCTREVLVIVAALSMQDPRERPADKQTQADQSHARFRDEHSDFMSLLNLWAYLKDQQKSLSHSAFRRLCRGEFLHYLRVREWQDLHSQMRRACQDLGIDPRRATAARDEAPDADVIHQALLAGLLSQIGLRDEAKRDYLGARGARFGISPGSTLFRRQPSWVMSAELVETTRLWARTNARIDPVWAERLGAHLVKRSYSEPRWSRKQGSVVATERVTLYGVPLVAARTVQYARVNPEEARDLFIRHALVEGDWDTHHEFVKANNALLQRLSDLEERARRRDILVDDEDLVAFFDARIPADVVSQRHFDRWWRGARREQPTLLTFTEELLTRDSAGGVSATDYPRTWHQGGLELAVTYQFEPGAAADGVTVHIPVQVLNQVVDEGFDWQVPGLRQDLATALLRSLPKATRVRLVPAPDHAARALADARPGGRRRLADELSRALRAQTGVQVPPEQFAADRVPDHLRVTFSVEDGSGRVLGAGKDLEELQERLAGQVQRRMSRAGASIERKGLRAVGLRRPTGHLRVAVRRAPGAGVPCARRPRRRGRPRRDGGGARGRGSHRARRAPAAAAQHQRTVEARAGAADQRTEARPGRQPPRLGARSARRRSGRRGGLHRRRAGGWAGSRPGGLRGGPRGRADAHRDPGARGGRPGGARARGRPRGAAWHSTG